MAEGKRERQGRRRRGVRAGQRGCCCQQAAGAARFQSGWACRPRRAAEARRFGAPAVPSVQDSACAEQGSGMKASPEPGKQQPEQQQGQVAAAAAGKEPDPRWARDGARSEATEAERLRTRERLEATLAGLAELEFLRQRQELRVKRLLAAAPSASLPGICSGERTRAAAGAGIPPRSLEEKFLEENILLLRRQLVSRASQPAKAVGAMQGRSQTKRGRGGGRLWGFRDLISYGRTGGGGGKGGNPPVGFILTQFHTAWNRWEACL